MKAPSLADREAVRHRTVLPRFRDAFAGVSRAYREEPNLRFHCFAGSCVAVAAYAVKVEAWEATYLGATVALVLLAEMVNTAVERTVDLAANGRRHPLAAQAKEIAAGAVLLTALHATLAAVVIFVIRRGLLDTLRALVHTADSAPWIFVLPLLMGVLGLMGGGRGSSKEQR